MTIRGKNIEPRALHSSHFDNTLRNGFIPLNMDGARRVGSTSGESWGNATVSAGYMSSASAPALTAVSTSVRIPVAHWTSASLVPIQFPTVLLPPDYSTLSSGTLHLLAGRAAAGSSDTGPIWDVGIFVSTGTVSTRSVSITAASSVATDYTVSMPSVGYPAAIAITAFPLSTADSNKLYGAWIEYTRNSTNTT